MPDRSDSWAIVFGAPRGTRIFAFQNIKFSQNVEFRILPFTFLDALYHPTHGKPIPGGRKILFHEYAARLINPEIPPPPTSSRNSYFGKGPQSFWGLGLSKLQCIVTENIYIMFVLTGRAV